MKIIDTLVNLLFFVAMPFVVSWLAVLDLDDHEAILQIHIAAKVVFYASVVLWLIKTLLK